MGIRGLTTFINNRQHLYLKDYELHDCHIVIDGNSVASNLYKWHCKSNDCFGGDYDKFAHVVRNFFEALAQCNIKSYVILDGGYEKRKLNTVINRMRNKIHTAETLNAVTEGSDSVFPLFLREVFVDVVVSLGIKVVRCKLEADMDIAGMARILDCPVVSYDSDFYIFGCMYIPFSTVDLTVRKGKKHYMYMSCKIYHIENFLEAFGGLDKNNLPLLAVLLGNDYINGSLFRPFFRNLKIQKCSGNQSDQQKRIKSVIVWLQNETIESGIKTVLSRFKGPKRQIILKKIQMAMKTYFQIDSDLLQYLHIEPIKKCEDINLDFDKLNDETKFQKGEVAFDDLSEEEPTESSDIEAKDDDILEENSDSEENLLSTVFQRNYRSCQYGACFMDMITLKRYYCIPQVEESSSPHSHTISLNILNIIYKILNPCPQVGLKIICRTGKGKIQFITLPVTDVDVPTLEEIQNSSLEERKKYIFRFLSLDNSFSEVLTQFPVEWHTFLIALKYAADKGCLDNAIIYSCWICFIILNYVDLKVGFYRASKTFYKRFASILATIKNQGSQKFENFYNLSINECVVFMDKMITNFQMDAKLKINHRLYDKVLVHSLSELQSVFLHVKYLNSLLNNPFPLLEIHKIFDGTFIYNITVNLRKRTDIEGYLDLLLKDSECILGGIKHVQNVIGKYLTWKKTAAQPLKKHKRKRNKKVNSNDVDIEQQSEDEGFEAVLDPNNFYSVLAVS